MLIEREQGADGFVDFRAVFGGRSRRMTATWGHGADMVTS